jgi:hypothetical protein
VDNPKKQSNEEFLSDLINFSKAGPIAQAIIVCAIEDYLNRVLEAGEPKEVKFSLISNKQWYDACVILKKEFNAKYC